MNNNEDVYKILGATNHSKTNRVNNDFYATPKIALDKLFLELEKLEIKLPALIVEPGVGTGNIAKPLSDKGHSILPFDIEDRGYPGTNVTDWLSVNKLPNVDLAIVANFPYNDIQSHTEHSLSLLKNGEYLIELAKIQFLEGKARKKMFNKFPPKYVLVFSERIRCLTNGEESKSSSAMCFCWFIFQKGFKGFPQVDWL